MGEVTGSLFTRRLWMGIQEGGPVSQPACCGTRITLPHGIPREWAGSSSAPRNSTSARPGSQRVHRQQGAHKLSRPP